MRCLVLVLLCVLALFICLRALKTDSSGEFIIFLNDNNSWDYLRFTQQWPPSVCITPEAQHCYIPEKTQFWTVHGIWPNKFNEHIGPVNCNQTWHFNIKSVSSIEDELNFEWPDLVDAKPSSLLWKHEWEKHGTCAASLPAMNSILKYFKEGLSLREKYDMKKLLSQAGIEPDFNKTLKISTIKEALVNATGSNPLLQCSYKKELNGTATLHYLSVVQLCLDKKFQTFDCPDANGTDCPKSGIIYLPFPG